MSVTSNTFNVCYLREYMDPDGHGEYFYAYETVYRNVPMKYKKKFSKQSMKMKVLKFCDWNYKESAVNYQNVSKVELIEEKQYYTTYADVFGKDTVDPQDHKKMFNDYGQQYHRQSLRKDFNIELTRSKVRSYNDRGIH